jgi:phosphoglycolate phosphatase-like HAD superfamily hydrolase
LDFLNEAMMIRTIFWDYDGVIAETLDIKGEAFSALFSLWGKEAAAFARTYHDHHGGVNRYEKIAAIYWALFHRTIPKEIAEELAQKFSDIILEKVLKAPLVPGVKEFLRSHREIDHYMISATPMEEIRFISKAQGLAVFFRDIYGSPVKKSEWVKKIIGEGKAHRNSSVFIGDARSDYEAAKENHIKFILRETDKNPKLFSHFHGPRVKDFRNLNESLKQLDWHHQEKNS